MEKKDLIWIATKAFSKGWDYEQVKYGDDLFDKENLIDDVWQYVDEISAIGHQAFYEKYKEYKMY